MTEVLSSASGSGECVLPRVFAAAEQAVVTEVEASSSTASKSASWDLDALLERAWKGERPSAKQLIWVCDKAKEKLTEELNIVEVPLPTTLVGDIHGQFFDILEMFARVGRPPQQSF